MPRRRQVWDEIRKEGNPTKSEAINDLIKKIEKHEVRGTGVATTARRPIEWDEYIMLLIAARHVFSHREKAMYTILAIMSFQWHFIGQIDNIMSLVTTTIQLNLRHPSCLQLKMRKSRNI
jgi:preprotein translocase subunit Sss1